MGAIVVAGESLVDLIVDPAGGLRPALGGGPYNTARTIGRLGGDVAFLGCLSRDRFGGQLLQGLVDDGVGTRMTVGPTRRRPSPWPSSPRWVRQLSLLCRWDRSARHWTRTRRCRALELRPWAIHLGTLGLVFEPIGTSIETLVGRLPAATWLMLDPNARPSATPDLDAWRARIARLSSRAAVVRVTTDDMAVLYPGVAPLVAARSDARRGTDAGHPDRRRRPGAGVDTGRDPLEVPVPPVEVVDTVGSGDAFGGAFLAWWQAHGLGPGDLADIRAAEAATRAAIRVAAITCARVGADPPTLAELGGWD